jgi:hypothetical protein
MTGGRAPRAKGTRAERAVVHLLQEHGLAAERVPLSGSARGRFGGDISVPALGRDLRGEVKARTNGFARLYDWLEGNDFLVLRSDRRPLLVVAKLELAAEIVMAAERALKTGSHAKPAGAAHDNPTPAQRQTAKFASSFGGASHSEVQSK